MLADATFDYDYDLEGNLVLRTNRATGAAMQYFYDHRQRLTRVDELAPGGALLHRTEFTYDAFDRRIATTVDGVSTFSVYDDKAVWADFDEAGAVTARYLYGDAVDELLARHRPSQGTAWYLTDRLGTVRDIAAQDGVVVDHLEYDSYGNVLSESNVSIGDRFKFTGREFDSQTGLYYYRARYYDPGTGRFITEDPIGFRAGDANLRRYVGNSPNNATDPSGLFAISDYGGLISANIAVVEAALSFGGNEPFTFSVGGNSRGVGGNFQGNPSASGDLPGGGGGVGLSKKGFTYTPPNPVKPFDNPFGPIPISGGLPDSPPPDESEFDFFVSATATEMNLIASFNVAVFAGVAAELSLIAKVAVSQDASRVEVNFKDEQDGSWTSHGFANLSPQRGGDSAGNPGPGGPNPPPPPSDPPSGGGPPGGSGGPGGPGGGPYDGGGGGCGSSGGIGGFGGIVILGAYDYLPPTYTDVRSLYVKATGNAECFYYVNRYYVVRDGGVLSY